MKMIKSIKLFTLLFSSITFAQTSEVSGTINLVNEDGLHRIRIPQNMRSLASHDLRDFRIWDAKGNQVPYFVQPVTDYKKTQFSDFKQFPIISNTKIVDTSSTYIFENINESIDKAVLLIANYQGSKSYKLEGSNNQEAWFGIVNKGELHQLNHPTETNVYKAISFPLGKYKFLKIVFNDRQSLPINLLKIGMANTETVNIVPVSMEEIPVKSRGFVEEDSKTQIHINFDGREVLNQIRIKISAPDLYSRNAVLYTIKEREVKRSMESYREPIAAFTIRSDKALIFDIPNSLEKEVYLEIDNKDNPKLQIDAIQFMQEPVYLVASLKENDKYTITAGFEKLDFPDYDIAKVTNTTKTELPLAKISNIVFGKPAKVKHESTSFWQQKWFMWACIIMASLMISFFAFNLLKDLNKDKNVS